MVGGFISYFAPAVVICTAASTMAMFLGLTSYALLMTDDDLNILGGLLVSLIYVFIPVIIFCFLFPNFFIYFLIQGFIVVLISIYIVYDTRLIITKMSFDDYIIAAILLYVDIINLFIFLLALFGSVASS